MERRRGFCLVLCVALLGQAFSLPLQEARLNREEEMSWKGRGLQNTHDLFKKRSASSDSQPALDNNINGNSKEDDARPAESSPGGKTEATTSSPDFDSDEDDDDFPPPASTGGGGGSNIFGLLKLANAFFPSSSGGAVMRNIIRRYLTMQLSSTSPFLPLGFNNGLKVNPTQLRRQDISENLIHIDDIKVQKPPLLEKQEIEDGDESSSDSNDDSEESDENNAAEESLEETGNGNNGDGNENASKPKSDEPGEDKGSDENDSDFSEEPEGGGGGILGILASLSGGEDGQSDLGSLLATVSGIVGNLSGDGFDLNALIASGLGLFVGILSQGDENPGAVIASYLLTSLDTITEGGAKNNGAFFGTFLSKLLRGISAEEKNKYTSVNFTAIEVQKVLDKPINVKNNNIPVDDDVGHDDRNMASEGRPTVGDSFVSFCDVFCRRSLVKREISKKSPLVGGSGIKAVAESDYEYYSNDNDDDEVPMPPHEIAGDSLFGNAFLDNNLTASGSETTLHNRTIPVYEPNEDSKDDATEKVGDTTTTAKVETATPDDNDDGDDGDNSEVNDGSVPLLDIGGNNLLDYAFYPKSRKRSNQKSSISTTKPLSATTKTKTELTTKPATSDDSDEEYSYDVDVDDTDIPAHAAGDGIGNSIFDSALASAAYPTAQSKRKAAIKENIKKGDISKSSKMIFIWRDSDNITESERTSSIPRKRNFDDVTISPDSKSTTARTIISTSTETTTTLNESFNRVQSSNDSMSDVTESDSCPHVCSDYDHNEDSESTSSEKYISTSSKTHISTSSKIYVSTSSTPRVYNIRRIKEKKAITENHFTTLEKVIFPKKHNVTPVTSDTMANLDTTVKADLDIDEDDDYDDLKPDRLHAEHSGRINNTYHHTNASDPSSSSNDISIATSATKVTSQIEYPAISSKLASTTEKVIFQKELPATATTAKAKVFYQKEYEPIPANHSTTTEKVKFQKNSNVTPATTTVSKELNTTATKPYDDDDTDDDYEDDLKPDRLNAVYGGDRRSLWNYTNASIPSHSSTNITLATKVISQKEHLSISSKIPTTTERVIIQKENNIIPVIPTTTTKKILLLKKHGEITANISTTTDKVVFQREQNVLLARPITKAIKESLQKEYKATIDKYNTTTGKEYNAKPAELHTTTAKAIFQKKLNLIIPSASTKINSIPDNIVITTTKHNLTTSKEYNDEIDDNDLKPDLLHAYNASIFSSKNFNEPATSATKNIFQTEYQMIPDKLSTITAKVIFKKDHNVVPAMATTKTTILANLNTTSTKGNLIVIPGVKNHHGEHDDDDDQDDLKPDRLYVVHGGETNTNASLHRFSGSAASHISNGSKSNFADGNNFTKRQRLFYKTLPTSKRKYAQNGHFYKHQLTKNTKSSSSKVRVRFMGVDDEDNRGNNDDDDDDDDEFMFESFVIIGNNKTSTKDREASSEHINYKRSVVLNSEAGRVDNLERNNLSASDSESKPARVYNISRINVSKSKPAQVGIPKRKKLKNKKARKGRRKGGKSEKHIDYTIPVINIPEEDYANEERRSEDSNEFDREDHMTDDSKATTPETATSSLEFTTPTPDQSTTKDPDAVYFDDEEEEKLQEQPQGRPIGINSNIMFGDAFFPKASKNNKAAELLEEAQSPIETTTEGEPTTPISEEEDEEEEEDEDEDDTMPVPPHAVGGPSSVSGSAPADEPDSPFWGLERDIFSTSLQFATNLLGSANASDFTFI